MDALEVSGWVFLAVAIAMYFLLVVYLGFVMYGMSQIAIFVVVILGSFCAPILVPIIFLVLLGCGVINERVRTVIA